MDCSERLKIRIVVLYLRDVCLRFLYGHAYKFRTSLTQRIKHYGTKSYIDHYQCLVVNRSRLTLLLSLRHHNAGGLYSCRLFIFDDKKDSLYYKRIMNDPNHPQNILGDDFVIDVDGGFEVIDHSLRRILVRDIGHVDGSL